MLFIFTENFIDEIKQKIEEYTVQIKNEIYTHRPKENARKSVVWNVFHEILDDKDNAVEQFYYCIECQTVLHSARIGGSTTKLLRHSCVVPAARNEVNINDKDLETIKRAAAKFICINLRPLNAIDCTGLRELFLAGAELGQKYPTMNTEDILQVIPSRNTIKGMIADEAMRARDAIKILFRAGVEQGGIGCTLDLWTDDHKSNSYMAMTANLFLIRDSCIELKRLVFHMGYIADIVKSKDVVKSRIIEVFHDFDVTTEEIKQIVTFCTDR